MKILTTPAQISTSVRRLIARHDHLSWAVAWATLGFPAAVDLLDQRTKIRRIIVGLHFYQTHPDFIRAFNGDDRVRYIRQTRGVFHPKIFMFESNNGAWDCIIGSANFTAGGFGSNLEVATHISSKDQDATSLKGNIDHLLSECWGDASRLTGAEIDAYAIMWAANAPALRRLAGQFGGAKATRNRDDDGGRAPTETQLLLKSWTQYLTEVRNERHFSMEGRVKILGQFREWFHTHHHFHDMPIEYRKRIAGCAPPSDRAPVDWHWFGSMLGAGYFKERIGKLNSTHISAALDQIPLKGPVLREFYQAFTARFLEAFKGTPGGGKSALATASRLLAMKRPDYFVCVDSKNRKGLCSAFGIRQDIDFDDYWDSLCVRIYEAAWWVAPEPDTPEARSVWQGRAAFLDALFYNPT